MIGEHLKRKRLEALCENYYKENGCNSKTCECAYSKYCPSSNLTNLNQNSPVYLSVDKLNEVYNKQFPKPKPMNKRELETGMIVKLRNGSKLIVVKDVCSKGSLDLESYLYPILNIGNIINFRVTLSSYTWLLNHNQYESLDIVEVWKIPFDNILTLDLNFDLEDKAELIYKRTVRMTLKEIEEELGYQIELVEEKTAD